MEQYVVITKEQILKGLSNIRGRIPAGQSLNDFVIDRIFSEGKSLKPIILDAYRVGNGDGYAEGTNLYEGKGFMSNGTEEDYIKNFKIE